jgi:phage protein D
MGSAAVDIFSDHQTFYVPRFEVRIANNPLPEGVIRDVMLVTYKDSIEEIDSFELKVNNWDALKMKLKYEPASDPKYSGIFDPGKKLELRLGYAKDIQLMVTGAITSLEPNYPESGGPTLTVRGLNQLHEFRTEQHTDSWTDRRDSDIAHELGQRPLRAGRAGLGIEVRIDPEPGEPKETYVFMNSQYDIVFLLDRARRHGYEVVLMEEQKGGSTQKFLRFAPSRTRAAAPEYKLEYGKTLLAFRPTLTTAKQISEVTVRGWDRRNNKAIEEKASWQDLVPAGPERDRLNLIGQAFGSRKEIVTNRPVHTVEEARRLAKDILRGQLQNIVKASGSSIGLPDLRAGRKVVIAGLGDRFNGEYYITQSTHTLGDGGYRTEFEARRDPGDQQ